MYSFYATIFVNTYLYFKGVLKWQKKFVLDRFSFNTRYTRVLLTEAPVRNLGYAEARFVIKQQVRIRSVTFWRFGKNNGTN